MGSYSRMVSKKIHTFSEHIQCLEYRVRVQSTFICEICSFATKSNHISNCPFWYQTQSYQQLPSQFCAKENYPSHSIRCLIEKDLQTETVNIGGLGILAEQRGCAAPPEWSRSHAACPKPGSIVFVVQDRGLLNSSLSNPSVVESKGSLFQGFLNPRVFECKVCLRYIKYCL